MTNTLLLRDDIPNGPSPDFPGAWFFIIRESLTGDPQSWVATVTEIGELSDDNAWRLLGWVETAATWVVRSRSETLLTTAVFAMALVLQSRLDPRDCSIVGSLLRRASVLARLDYRRAVVSGCRRAGAFGEAAFGLLWRVDPNTPGTHAESGVAESFIFARERTGFDGAAYMRMIGDGFLVITGIGGSYGRVRAGTARLPTTADERAARAAMAGAARARLAQQMGFTGSGSKIIVDQSSSWNMAQWLRDAGYDARSVAEMGIQGATETAIHQLAIQVRARVLGKKGLLRFQWGWD